LMGNDTFLAGAPFSDESPNLFDTYTDTYTLITRLTTIRAGMAARVSHPHRLETPM